MPKGATLGSGGVGVANLAGSGARSVLCGFSALELESTLVEEAVGAEDQAIVIRRRIATFASMRVEYCIDQPIDHLTVRADQSKRLGFGDILLKGVNEGIPEWVICSMFDPRLWL